MFDGRVGVHDEVVKGVILGEFFWRSKKETAGDGIGEKSSVGGGPGCENVARRF